MIFTCTYKNDGHMEQNMWIVTAHFPDGSKRQRVSKCLRDAMAIVLEELV